jgi:hypothetical protein
MDSPIGFKTFCGCKNRRTLLLFFTNSIAIILRPKASAIPCYQYLGMAKILGTQNVLPKTFLRAAIDNDTTLLVMQRYEETQDYAEFFGAMVVVWVDVQGLLPCTAVCLV